MPLVSGHYQLRIFTCTGLVSFVSSWNSRQILNRICHFAFEKLVDTIHEIRINSTLDLEILKILYVRQVNDIQKFIFDVNLGAPYPMVFPSKSIEFYEKFTDFIQNFSSNYLNRSSLNPGSLALHRIESHYCSNTVRPRDGQILKTSFLI